MARYIVTSGSNFQPMTYDELVKPLAQMTEAYNTAGDTFDALSADTETLRQYINKETDPDTQALYDNYVTLLGNLQNNLWENGYNSQTKRDLSRAMNAYRSDITRIAKAIETRQARSQEYWKTRHEHPDMITSTDPGTGSLDEYMKNDLYGQNYYSYSGNSFMTEVGISAKAAAEEMMNDPRYRNNPDAVGYLMRLQREGYSSSEVQRAGDAVYDAVFNNSKEKLMSKLSEPEKILANVLMTHLDSTGAYDKVSREEFKRLYDYGVEGLRQAIGTRKVADLQDRTYVTPKAGNGSGKDNSSINGYSINKVVSEYTNPGYKNFAKEYGDYYKPYYDESSGAITPITIHVSDAEPDVQVGSPLQMSGVIYDSPARQSTRQQWKGVDLTILPTTDKRTQQMFTVTQTNPKNNARYSIDFVTYPLTKDGLDKLEEKAPDLVEQYNLKEGSPAIYYMNNGTPSIHIEGTASYTKRLSEHNNYVEDIKKNNPGIDFNKVALSPGKERELRNKEDIPGDIQTADLDAYVSTKYDRFVGSNPVLFNGDGNAAPLRGDLLMAIANSFRREKANGNVGKGTKAAFYEVSNGKTSSEGTTDLSKVFPDAKSLTYVDLDPNDIDFNTGRVLFTLTTPTGIWKVDSDMLGSEIVNLFNSPSADGYSLKQKLFDMLLPLKDPHKALTMSDKEAERWAREVFGFFNPVNPETENYYQTPYGNISFPNGQPSLATPADIVRDADQRTRYRNSVVRFITYQLQAVANEMGQHHMQTTNNTNSKASPYMNWSGSSSEDYDYTEDIDFDE